MLEENVFGLPDSELNLYFDESRGVLQELGDVFLGDNSDFSTLVTGIFLVNEMECDPSLEKEYLDGCLQHFNCYLKGSSTECNSRITYYNSP